MNVKSKSKKSYLKLSYCWSAAGALESVPKFFNSIELKKYYILFYYFLYLLFYLGQYIQYLQESTAYTKSHAVTYRGNHLNLYKNAISQSQMHTNINETLQHKASHILLN